ncbi:MAG: hypothetical protein HY791_11585 [Deltaproteobacteria bacterium]|nr:hypothetical protein [Deltaproteobacteria bacterium]
MSRWQSFVDGPKAPSWRAPRAVLALLFELALFAGCSDDAEPLVGHDAGVWDAARSDSSAHDSGGGPDVSMNSGVDAGPPDLGPPELILAWTEELSPRVRARIERHLEAVSTRPVRVTMGPVTAAAPGSLVLSLGDRTETRRLIPESELVGKGSEGFIVRAGALADGTPLLAADGNALAPDPSGHVNISHGNIGLVFASYALLEELGFAFLHPLSPVRPETLLEPPTLSISESPHWRIRGMQVHTMHPLELTDLLNGWGATPDDPDQFTAQLPEWESLCEWLVANRQNRVHWVLLAAESWATFGDSTLRQNRLKQLADIGHDFGIAVGVDAPIALGQQHSFRLLRQSGELEAEKAEIRSRVDYLMTAGFDYLATEAGTSEFTHPDDHRMLAWMNELARHLDETYGAPAYIKIHTSAGQAAENYLDPDTGEPINFNYLPHFADARLGVMPHTVQHYAVDDPAPTYGNRDFSGMHEFLKREAGAREVVWHPETAYWVSFDIDVPLFLPLYGERRFHDLRILAKDELDGTMGRGSHQGARMDGQIVFSSGWEWGYWLNDVVAARAAWNPMSLVSDERAALRQLVSRALSSFGPEKDQWADFWVRSAVAQEELLIEGRVNGVAPSDIEKRNGQAYLQGYETWDEVGELATSLGLVTMITQPEKLGMVEMRNPLHGGPGYSAEVEPLLAAMARQFEDLADEAEGLRANVPSYARPLADDLVDASRITALRARQVHGLYDYVDGYWDTPEAQRRMRLDAARAALDAAAELVTRREAAYRVPADRIAGWRSGPTAYEYTYLWTVRTLYYWWRDEGKAVDAPFSPCYLNVVDPVNVGFGEGLWADAAQIARDVADGLPAVGSLAECLASTPGEPTFPQDGLRSRP